MSSEFQAVFDRLRSLLQRNAGGLTAQAERPGYFCLEAFAGPKLAEMGHSRAGRTIPTAWVQVAKTYVSYHLMPVYGCPQLLDGVSPRLKARMQGKSCFNFKEVDEALFAELEALTVRGFAAFKKSGFAAAGPAR